MPNPIAVGPLLGVESDTTYTICFLLEKGGGPPEVQLGPIGWTPADHVADTPNGRFWRCAMDVPAEREGRAVSYSIRLDGELLRDGFERDRWTFYVPGADERIRTVYASCNGFSAKPAGDEQYVLWSRMREQHAERPFSLLLMGGDQLYADEIWTSERAPLVGRWYEESRETRSKADPDPGMARELDAFYESLYLRHWAKEDMSFMMASVPSLMMWDDHDIFDGWGSYPDDLQSCPVYAEIYKAASRYFTIFQLRSLENGSLLGPDNGHYSSALVFRGHAILALDNRSGRTLERVMTEENWLDVKRWLAAQRSCRSLFVLSAVPVVYRSFARAERIMGATPWHEELEDDVHDHWSAELHEGERLKLVMNLLEFKQRVQAGGGRVVILSGDVHVGSIGVIRDERDPARPFDIHQVVSSGVVHPAPSWVQWQGINATSTDELETLDRAGVTAENVKPVGGDKFIRTRNYLALEEGNDDKLWVEWICEDERRREYGIARSPVGDARDETVSTAKDGVDERALATSMEREVAAKGFAGALRNHVKDLARIYRERPLRSDAESRQLLDWMRKDPEIRHRLDHLSSEDERKLRRELAGAEPDLRDSLRREDFIGRRLFGLAEAEPAALPELVEGTGEPIKVYHDRDFENWGQTVANRPAITCVPRTREGVRNIVKWAAARNKTVRVSGYRHTWSDLYGSDDDVLISLLPLKFAEELPSEEPKLDPTNELQGIEIVGEVQENGETKALCRIGAATTNEMFREWCVPSQSKSQWKDWTLPLNVIMVEITYGGSNGPICHGAGRGTRTLSDLVHEIEFVNAKGDIQTVSHPDLLRAASGCFGLLGVVISLTLKLDPMTYAHMHPTTPRVALAVPPPAGFEVPDEVDMSGLTTSQLEAARLDFVRQCEEDTYSEWFWFVFSDECWVNCWKNTGTKDQAEDYPGPVRTELQEVMEYLAHLANKSLFRILPGRVQAEVMSRSAMSALPSGEDIVTPLIDALHFQRGIQNMRVYDMEFEIPIPARADDPTKPDWGVCQKAWWAVIRAVYAHDETPLRLTMEMRITGDSNVLMAPQFGNEFGTCSIEILTPANVPQDEWRGFMQQITDEWASYTDPLGNPLNVRTHWAKEWQGLSIRGKPILDHIRQDGYPARIQEFKIALSNVAAAEGYTLDDARARFSNALLDQIFFA